MYSIIQINSFFVLVLCTLLIWTCPAFSQGIFDESFPAVDLQPTQETPSNTEDTILAPRMPDNPNELGLQILDSKPAIAGNVDNFYRDIQIILNAKQALGDESVDPNSIRSLLFTQWQHSLLQDAKKASSIARAPTSSELNASEEDDVTPTGPRVISLGGISYVAGGRWTIWLNGQRITPDALPEEIVDISVGSRYVDLKWFDNNTSLIFPIRLRPHQRFDLDSRIFLPGTGSAQ